MIKKISISLLEDIITITILISLFLLVIYLLPNSFINFVKENVECFIYTTIGLFIIMLWIQFKHVFTKYIETFLYKYIFKK